MAVIIMCGSGAIKEAGFPPSLLIRVVQLMMQDCRSFHFCRNRPRAKTALLLRLGDEIRVTIPSDFVAPSSKKQGLSGAWLLLRHHKTGQTPALRAISLVVAPRHRLALIWGWGGEILNQKNLLSPLVRSCRVMLYLLYWLRDVAQLGSAPALGAGCRRFKSCHPDSILSPRRRTFTTLAVTVTCLPYSSLTQ